LLHLLRAEIGTFSPCGSAGSRVRLRSYIDRPGSSAIADKVPWSRSEGRRVLAAPSAEAQKQEYSDTNRWAG